MTKESIRRIEEKMTDVRDVPSKLYNRAIDFLESHEITKNELDRMIEIIAYVFSYRFSEVERDVKKNLKTIGIKND